MPRRIDPHLYERSDELPSDRAEMFQLPESVLEAISAELPEDLQELAQSAISYALAQYEWEREVGPFQYRRAEAAEALRKLVKQPIIDFGSVGALNKRAFDDLYMLGNSELQSWMLTPVDRPIPFEEIKAAAARVLRMYRSWRGPDPNTALHWLVRHLCEIHEEVTGEVATLHNKDQDRLYSEKPQTDAGRFVSRIIKAAHPSIRHSAISNQMKGHIKQRQKERAEGTNPSDT